ncbi:unnamed protein product [Sphagnum balticum]
MQCFESLDDAKKKIPVDLTNKNSQYAVIPFTSKNWPSTNKLWDRMGQVVVKASGEWVCFDGRWMARGGPKRCTCAHASSPLALVSTYTTRETARCR